MNEKIVQNNRTLTDWLESGSSEPATLLVEIDLPERRILIQPAPPGVARMLSATIVTEPTTEDSEEKQEYIAHSLTDITGTPPRWLNSSRTFIVKANTHQAQEILDMQGIKAVHLNRTINTPAHA